MSRGKIPRSTTALSAEFCGGYGGSDKVPKYRYVHLHPYLVNQTLNSLIGTFYRQFELLDHSKQLEMGLCRRTSGILLHQLAQAIEH